jgi:AraC-like DNA-binding protein
MGFACISTVLLPGRGFVLTAGPYLPPEGLESRDRDAEAGLAAIQRSAEEAPEGWLDDLSVNRPDAVAEVTVWGAEALAARWQAFQTEQATPEPGPAEEDRPRTRPARRSAARPGGVHGDAAAVAAALAAGGAAQARELARSALADAPRARGGGRVGARARRVALAAAVLECAEAAGQDTAAAWERFPELLPAPDSSEAALDGLMAVLRTLRPRRTRVAGTADTAPAGHDMLHQLVCEGLTAGITLNEVARTLGRSPAAVTRGLQKAYGMSFTEYVNRLRVDRAKELLRRTQLRIGEVAVRVGLTDASNLGRLFRRFEGVSPSEYRTRNAGHP